MILLMWALKVSLLSMRTPRSRILSVKDMGRERINTQLCIGRVWCYSPLF